ncbi:MAG TPA: TrkA family potassium uptake protein [Anaerolineales bacterium]|nr:TrkA family potassium uptake protein [Anaerolineales bacterium]
MNFVIVGCGRVGAELALRLYRSNYNVVVVDQNEEALNRIDPEFRGRTVHGEVLRRDVLDRAGIKYANGLAAVTNSDTVNAVVAHAARTIYQVPVVVCRNYDPRLRSMLEIFDIQIVSSTAWGAQRTEEILTGVTSRAVFSAGNGEVEVYELMVPQAWHGRSWKDLCLSIGGFSPVAITRAGRASLPSAETKLESGDLLTVSATFDGIKALRARLDSKGEA